MNEQKSPIEGGKFKKKLTPEYAKLKKKTVGNTRANLEASGEMKDETGYKVADGNLKMGVYGEAAPRADGHTNLSGKSDLPGRDFLPKKGQTYKKEIRDEVDNIIKEHISNTTTLPQVALRNAATKTEFWKILSSTFQGFSRSQIREAIALNKSKLSFISSIGASKWL